MRSGGSRPMTRNPASDSETIVDASSSGFFVTGGAWIRSTKSAVIASMPALIANTTPVDVTAIRSPASAGPAKMARLSIELAMAFAAVSCAGLVVSDGVSAA